MTGAKITYSVLETFSVYLLLTIRKYHFLSSTFNCASSFSADVETFVLSANIKDFTNSKQCGGSFTYNKNWSKFEPWGTRHSISFLDDLAVFTLDVRKILSKWDINQFTVFPVIHRVLVCQLRSYGRLCQMLSVSRGTVLYLLVFINVQKPVTCDLLANNDVTVEWNLRNPNWLFGKMLFSFKYAIHRKLVFPKFLQPSIRPKMAYNCYGQICHRFYK